MSAIRSSSQIAHRELGASQQRPRRNQGGGFTHKRRLQKTYAHAPEAHGVNTLLRRSCRIARKQEAVRQSQAGAIPREKRSTPSTRLSVDTEALSLSPAQRVLQTLELVVNILVYLPAVKIIGTERVSKTFKAANDEPRCRIITFMRSIDDALVLPPIAKTVCAALCPLLQTLTSSTCRFAVTERSNLFSSPGSWEKMYLTNRPVRDAVFYLTFRNSLFWGATIMAELRIREPGGLTLGSILSRRSRGILHLTEYYDTYGNLVVHKPRTLLNKPFRSSCRIGVLGAFIKEQEDRLGGSFSLHVNEDESWANPKIELWVDIVACDGPERCPQSSE
jgi:hypothetical protein